MRSPNGLRLRHLLERFLEMSEAMTVGIVGVVGTLLGVVITHLLGDRTERIREERRLRERRDSVRTLVSIEIDQNLDLFREYWSMLKSLEAQQKAPGERGDEEFRRREQGEYWAGRLVSLPLPAWGHRSWDALIPSLPVALELNEIEKLTWVFSRLDALSTERTELVSLGSEDPGIRPVRAVGGQPTDIINYPKKFSDMAPAAWVRCEVLAREILETGNPLNPKPAEEAT